ncbi:hypothetical protein ACFL6P_04285 [Candidatus Latescibacterota bacterium]
MSLTLYIDFMSIVYILIILLISIALYYKVADPKERALAIGSFTRTLALAFSFFYAVRMLAVVDKISKLGPPLAIVLLTAFYGLLINLAIKIGVRFKYDIDYYFDGITGKRT